MTDCPPGARGVIAFPGQGVPPGVVTDVLSSCPNSEEVRALLEALGLDAVASIDMHDTRQAQPASYVASVLCARRMLAGPPECYLGHSLGEFSALTLAGGISFRDGLQVICARGEACFAVNRDRPGAMWAVMGIPADRAEELASDVADGTAYLLDVAAINSPTQFVLSGDERLRDTVIQLVNARKGIVAELSIGGAFHSRIMAGAMPMLASALSSVALTDPTVSVISTIEARPIAAPATWRRILVEALSRPVQWHASLECAARLGGQWVCEPGPGATLQRIARRGSPLPFVTAPSARIGEP